MRIRLSNPQPIPHQSGVYASAIALETSNDVTVTLRNVQIETDDSLLLPEQNTTFAPWLASFQTSLCQLLYQRGDEWFRIRPSPGDIEASFCSPLEGRRLRAHCPAAIRGTANATLHFQAVHFSSEGYSIHIVARATPIRIPVLPSVMQKYRQAREDARIFREQAQKAEDTVREMHAAYGDLDLASEGESGGEDGEESEGEEETIDLCPDIIPV